MPIRPKSIPGQMEILLRAAPRASVGKMSSGQPSPGAFQPNMGMSPGVTQFDAEFPFPTFPGFFTMSIPPKWICGRNGSFFCTPR